MSKRRLFIDKCGDVLNSNGYLFITVFSDQDKYYGQGKEIEKNILETKPGKIIHFFSQSDLIESFKSYQIIETGQIVDEVFHTEHGVGEYQLRYIFGRK